LRAWARAEAAFEGTRYVVIDVETTGLSARSHRVIEVALLRCRGMEVLDGYSTLVNPRRGIPAFIRSFTGITPEMLAGMPEMSVVLPGWREFLGAAPLVGHNVAFALGFLHGEMARHDAGLTLTNPALDTSHLAARLLPHLGKPSLDRLCAALA